MKIISWNCQGAYRKKAEFILSLQPDLVVVQECENPEKLLFKSNIPLPNDMLWYGDNIHKGVGIFSYSHYKLKLIDNYNEAYKFIAPISISGASIDFNLFAIWANHRHDPDGQYIEQIWKALNHYDELLNHGKTLLIGDFNSNKIWDNEHRVGSHSGVVQKLSEKNIYSVYHHRLSQEQGKEQDPTFFLQKNRNKPFHLDYCFASNDFIESLIDFEIGIYDEWIKQSDHMPLTITFNTR